MLRIEKTKCTPHVEFYENGKFSINGKSIPENIFIFYDPILKWLNEYIKHPSTNTILDVNLEYFNTSSSKCLLDMFKILSNIKLYNKHDNVTINWFVEDDDEGMIEAGEDFKSILKNINFNIINV